MYQDPSILDPTADFCVKHFIFVVVRPLYTQMPALEDGLQRGFGIIRGRFFVWGFSQWL